MILWKSMPDAVYVEYEEAVKRNKPILLFVKKLQEREKRGQKLKDFLLQLQSSNPAQGIRRTVYDEFRKISELQEFIRNSVKKQIEKFYEEPFQTTSREEMYKLGTDIIQYSQRRLYLFQKSPSLFLGARDYLADEKVKVYYEKDFLDSLEKWITRNKEFNNREFLYLFSSEGLSKELRKNDLIAHPNYTEYLNHVKEKIQFYKNIESQSGYRFRFDIIKEPISGPLIAGDNRYAIWLLGGDQAVCISQENEQICESVARTLRSYSQERRSASDIISVLDL